MAAPSATAHLSGSDLTIAFHLDTFDDGGNTIGGWSVDWGDGIGNTGGGGEFALIDGTILDSYSFPTPGTYEIVFVCTVGDDTVTLFDEIVTVPAPVDLDLPGVGDCPSFILTTRATEVTFDCETPDPLYGLAWIWQDIPGWWEPPAPDRDFIDGLGTPIVGIPTAARWQPRDLTMQATAVCGGSEGLLNALDTLTALSDMLGVPGTLTSTEAVPKRISVRLADRPTFEVLGEAQYLAVTIPMVAHSPLRIVVADDSLVV